MSKERVVLAFIAALLGLLAAGGAFYFIQLRSSDNSGPQPIAPIVTPQQKENSSIFLNIDKPKDEEVVENRTITVSGTTNPDADVLILTPVDEKAVTPTSKGSFSTTVSIDAGENVINITAVMPSGEEIIVNRTITFSTEDF